MYECILGLTENQNCYSEDINNCSKTIYDAIGDALTQITPTQFMTIM